MVRKTGETGACDSGKRDLNGRDLSGRDLSERDLSGRDLSGSGNSEGGLRRSEMQKKRLVSVDTECGSGSSIDLIFLLFFLDCFFSVIFSRYCPRCE